MNRCGIHDLAVVGEPPEDTVWRESGRDYCYEPRIEPTARIEAFVTVDAGIRKRTYIGQRVWLLKHVHVGHDAHIGDDCVLAVGTVIAGYAWLDKEVKCGIGALILPYRQVGRGATVGAGAVVTQDVPPGAVVAGNPARILHVNGKNLRPFTERTSEERVAKHA